MGVFFFSSKVMEAEANRVFEAQKQIFAERTDMFRQKMIKMYVRNEQLEGDATFDERIHAIWDEWSFEKRADFLLQAYKPIVQAGQNKEEILLAETCPELRDPKYFATESDTISKFLTLVANSEENSASYPWKSVVDSAVERMLDRLNWNVWMDFVNSKNKKSLTKQLAMEQRSLYVVQFATYLIANFCGEFTGSGPMGYERKLCHHCSKPVVDRKRCAKCKKVYYCSKNCQLNNWPNHRG